MASQACIIRSHHPQILCPDWPALCSADDAGSYHARSDHPGTHHTRQDHTGAHHACPHHARAHHTGEDDPW